MLCTARIAMPNCRESQNSAMFVERRSNSSRKNLAEKSAKAAALSWKTIRNFVQNAAQRLSGATMTQTARKGIRYINAKIAGKYWQMTKSSVQNAELPQKLNLWPAASPGIKENIIIGKNIQNTENPIKREDAG